MNIVEYISAAAMPLNALQNGTAACRLQEWYWIVSRCPMDRNWQGNGTVMASSPLFPIQMMICIKHLPAADCN